jgi:hypothetical protein
MNRTALPRWLMVIGAVLGALGAIALLLDGQFLLGAIAAGACVVLLGARGMRAK